MATQILTLLFLSVLGNNTVFGQALGIEPALRSGQTLPLAWRTGGALGIVMLPCGALCGLLHRFVLLPLGEGGALLGPLCYAVLAFLCVYGLEVLYANVARVSYETYAPDMMPALYMSAIVLGVFGAALPADSTVLDFVIQGCFAGLGYAFCAILLAGIQEERFSIADIPQGLKGFPIAMILLGLLAMVFSAFSHMKFLH